MHSALDSGVARTLALTVLLCTLTSILPFATLAGIQRCQLACCRGHAPHAAGSCMDGACEAMLIPARKSPVALHFQPGEKLCGFARVVKRKATVSPPERRILSPGNSSGEAQTRLSPTALSNPCSADCRGCISFTFNSNRFRTA